MSDLIDALRTVGSRSMGDRDFYDRISNEAADRLEKAEALAVALEWARTTMRPDWDLTQTVDAALTAWRQP